MYPRELIQTIRDGAYAVIPTDTIYGIVCDARNKNAVEKLYQIRKRDLTKPFIVLISDIQQLELFSIPWEQYAEILNRYWPGPVSIIMPCTSDEFSYLHRGSHSIAFRLPDHEELRNFIRAQGPIVAPSANPEQLPPAATIDEAKTYFGEQVAYYVDGGEIHAEPSTIVSIAPDGTVTKVR